MMQLNLLLIFIKEFKDHVANYQNMTFASKIEDCFEDRPPEVEQD